MGRRIRSYREAIQLLFARPAEEEPKRRDEHGRWQLLDPDVAWQFPRIKVLPLSLRSDRSLIAEFVGQEWPSPPARARSSERTRHGYIFWGVLKREPSGAIVPAEIAVAPLVLGGLTTTMLRSLSLERILERARAEIRDNVDWLTVAGEFGWKLPPAEEIERINELARKTQRLRSRRGRRGNPPEFYRALALEALTLQTELGITRGLRRELADRHNVEIPTVRDWLRRCRDLGFLAPAEWGKAGVEPGPRL